MKTVQNKSFGITDVGRNSGKRTLMTRFKIVLYSVLIVLAFGNQTASGQGVGISEAAITPDGSAILELRSTVRGFLRMESLCFRSLGYFKSTPRNECRR
jgi:hypothetical protein